MVGAARGVCRSQLALGCLVANGGLPDRRAAGDGLAYAHAKGVMHRDIKPANVLLTPSGRTEAGRLQRELQRRAGRRRSADTFGGSLVYMSPEQLQACHPVLGGSPQMVREASDVYSLGVCCGSLLCGTRPFDDMTKTNRWPRSSGWSICGITRNFDELARKLPADCPSRSSKCSCAVCSRGRRALPTAEEVARDLAALFASAHLEDDATGREPVEHG